MIKADHDVNRAIAAAPLFKGLPAVELAKLVSAVEARLYEPGEFMVPVGGRTDGLLILCEGVADIVTERPDGSTEAVAMLESGDTFGEVALGAVAEGGAGLVARTTVMALFLTQGRYRQLASLYPDFGRRLNLALGERLQARNRAIAELSITLRSMISQRLDQFDVESRQLLRQASLAESLSPGVIDALGGERLKTALQSLAEEPSLVSLDSGSGVMMRPLRDALNAELVSSSSVDELREVHRVIAQAREHDGDTPSAVRHFGAAEMWSDVVRLLETANGTLAESDRTSLRQWLRTVPSAALQSEPRLESINASFSEIATDEVAEKRGLFRLSRKNQWGIGLAIGLFALIALPTPPPGLSREGQLALAILAASVPLMVLEVIADHLVAVFLIVGWAGLGLVPARVALSGFANTTWFVVLAILGIGVGIGKTGLLYRAVLSLANWAPRNLVAQSLTLAVAGLLFTPSMPNATSRMALSAPVGLEMVDAFGLARRGASSVIIGIATLLGFGLMGTLFLTGTSSGLLVHSVLPTEVQAQFSFLPWLIGALPLHATLFVITLAAAIWMFRDGARVEVSNQLLRAQTQALGKPSSAEWISAVVMVMLIVGLVTEPWHKINAAWIAGAGLLVLGSLGIVDTTSFRNGINWSFVIFFGAITSLQEVFTTLKVDTWMGETMSQLLAPLAGVPTLFLLGFAAVGILMSFVVRWQAASVLFTLVMSPPAAAIGINPFVIGIIALTATNLWILPYQSTIYLALYSGVDGRLFSHEQIRPIAIVYAAAILVGVLVSVPFWRAMGLMP
jgi:DASS family divalent anion:Na+ symporter